MTSTVLCRGSHAPKHWTPSKVQYGWWVPTIVNLHPRINRPPSLCASRTLPLRRSPPLHILEWELRQIPSAKGNQRLQICQKTVFVYSATSSTHIRANTAKWTVESVFLHKQLLKLRELGSTFLSPKCKDTQSADEELWEVPANSTKAWAWQWSVIVCLSLGPALHLWLPQFPRKIKVHLFPMRPISPKTCSSASGSIRVLVRWLETKICWKRTTAYNVLHIYVQVGQSVKRNSFKKRTW